MEYPPLIAINEALVFRAAAPDGERAIRALFSLAWLAFVFLTLETCERYLTKLQAVLLAAFVAATPMVWEFGENGFADLRLTATLLLLLLEAVHWLDRRDTTSALRFSAVAAAAALTKNEGLMIASIAVLFMVGLVARRVVTWSATRAAIAILLLVVLA